MYKVFLVYIPQVFEALVFESIIVRQVIHRQCCLWLVKTDVDERNALRESYKNKYITSVIVGLFLQHPSIAQQTLYTFACKTVGYALKGFNY